MKVSPGTDPDLGAARAENRLGKSRGWKPRLDNPLAGVAPVKERAMAALLPAHGMSHACEVIR